VRLTFPTQWLTFGYALTVKIVSSVPSSMTKTNLKSLSLDVIIDEIEVLGNDNVDNIVSVGCASRSWRPALIALPWCHGRRKVTRLYWLAHN
jgi:hypothetical protein